MFFMLFGALIYIIFFIFLPGVGAVTLRRRWYNFRELVYRYSSVPALEYYNLQPGELFSFNGKLESFKDDDVVWLKGETLSICIDLNKQDIYTLSKRKDQLYKSQWDSVSSLVEGTRFYVFGHLEYNRGVPYLVGSGNEDLLVVITDGNESIFEMLLKNGRDKNEMWNSYTPYTYITGVLILIILSYFSYRTSFNKTSSFFLLLAAGTPFYFIIPPGLFFYLYYRRLWDISVRWSILRDLKRLKGDYYSSNIMKSKSKSRERQSLLFYLLGYLLNMSIASLILYRMFQLIIFS